MKTTLSYEDAEGREYTQKVSGSDTLGEPYE